MDRQTVYFGQLARETDLLLAEQNTMVALAKLAAGVLGTSTIVNNFTCTPTIPASLAVLLTMGEIYQIENLEATTWSSVSADTSDSILKQGIQLQPATFGITPPGTVGFSQVFLIEVQYQDLDTGSTVLPYFNASNPTSPFSGPGNSGSAQNTVRKGIVASQVKAGTAAATGTQVAPGADAGWTGLFTVTVANGQTTITSGNIAQVGSAPFIPTTLPKVPAGVQAGTWVFANDTGTVNNLVVTLNPAPTAYTTGLGIIVKAATVPTGASVINVNGLGNVALAHGDGSAILLNDWAAGTMLGLWYDGVKFQVAFKGEAIIQSPNLTAPQTYFVNSSTGSDGNNGLTSGTAFATIQHAIIVMNSFNLNGFGVTINVANGTYAPFSCLPLNGTGTCTIVGNTATPANVLVSASSGVAILSNNSIGYVLKGLKVASAANGSAGNPGDGISVNSGSIQIQNIEFGACAAQQLAVNSGGNVTILGPDVGVSSTFINVTGSAVNFILVQDCGTVTTNNANLNFTGTLTFSGPVVVATINGVLNGTWNGAITVTGSVTGTRFSATANGVINTNGQLTTYYPGSVAGSTGTGGQYL